MNNIHISYDLNVPGQNYEKVIDKIKSLGQWAKVNKSFWYLKTNLTSSQVAEAIWSAMDKSDSLSVVDATNNTASWRNLSDEVSNFIRERWANQRVA